MKKLNEAIELFFDALGGPDVGYYDRWTGVVDMQAKDIVGALLAAGWSPPSVQGWEPGPLIRNGDPIAVKKAGKPEVYYIVEDGAVPEGVIPLSRPDYSKLTCRRVED